MFDLSDCETYEERTKKLTTEYKDEFLDNIFTHVANGGSLIELCKIWKVHYGRIVSWLRADKDMNNRYTNAINDRVEFCREAILFEIRKLAFSDITGLFDDAGGLLPMHKWPNEVKSMVKSIDFDDEGEVKKVTLWNKEKCLEMLGKNMSMFVEKIEHTGKLTLEDLIVESIKKKEDKPKEDSVDK